MIGSVVPRGAVDKGGLGAIGAGSPESGEFGIEAEEGGAVAFPGVRPLVMPVFATLADNAEEEEGCEALKDEPRARLASGSPVSPLRELAFPGFSLTVRGLLIVFRRFGGK